MSADNLSEARQSYFTSIKGRRRIYLGTTGMPVELFSMDRESVINELRDTIAARLKAQGLDLVDLIFRYEGRDITLRILVDRPCGGISLDECAHLNNTLSAILDKKDILGERYILEVSSPGLDRPLTTASDYLRCINRKVRIFLKEQIEGKWELEGTINKVEGEAVFIEVGGAVLEAPLSKISKAKQII